MVRTTRIWGGAMSPDKSIRTRRSLAEADLRRAMRAARQDRDRGLAAPAFGLRAADSPLAGTGHAHDLDFKIKLMKG